MASIVSFDLAILEKRSRYRVWVLSEPLGWPETEVSIREVQRTLRERFPGFGSKPESLDSFKPSRLEAAQLGEWLFKTFFRGDVLAAWNACFRSGKALRLRLLLDDAPTLSSLPWEALCSGQGFLALQDRVTIVRSVSKVGTARPRDLQSPVPFLFLEAKQAELPGLETDSEWVEISKILARKGNRLRFDSSRAIFSPSRETGPPIPESLQILHFAGHGAFVREDRTGVTLHESSDGGLGYYLPQEWATDLTRLERLRLVVLNCCFGARHAADSVHTSLAYSFVRAGIPAVVAMQLPISDDAARAFSRGFYAAIAEGVDVSLAMNRGRFEIKKEIAEEWASPVLFLREAAPAGPGPWIRILRWVGLHRRHAAIGLVGLVAVALASLFADTIREHWWRAERWASEPARRVAPGLPRDLPFQCPDLSSVGIELVPIPPGEFTMGSSSGEPEEGPAHPVRLTRAYCLGKTEVSQREWLELMGSNPSSEKGDDLPVTKVSWYQAQEFIDALNRRLPGIACSLPTEAEFEYGAGAGQGLAFGSSDASDSGRYRGNCGGEGDRDGFRKLAPVKEFTANDLGLYGMVGNASEWVQDWYGEYSPDLAFNPAGPPTGRARVRKGGSYRHLPTNCRSSSRDSSPPEHHLSHFGFRVACKPLPKPLP